MGAVLCRAILDCTGNDRILSADKWRREADAWIFLSKKRSAMSFYWCCEFLSLCPKTMRKVIKRLKTSKEHVEFPGMTALLKVIDDLDS